MGYSKAVNAFEDIEAAFERALQAPKGIRIACRSRGEAVVLRSRFNYYRKLDRKRNESIYEPDHPMHGRSPYDRLVLRIPPKGNGDYILYIEPRSVEDLNIEEL